MRSDTPTPSKTQLTASEELTRTTLLATLGIFLSRISGIFRSQVVNAVFGATTALDAYNVALRLPSALRDLFAEGALSSAFTHALVHARNQNPEAEKKLLSTVVAFFSLVTIALAIAGAFFALPIIELTTDETFSARGGLPLAISCFQILVFYLPLAMLSSIWMSLLGVLRKTFHATIASAFFNAGMIAGALIIAPVLNAQGFPLIYGLAVGTLLGGCGQLIYQLIPLLRLKLIPLPKLQWTPELKRILLLMGPRALGQGALIIALVINTFFATSIGEGALTYITNAQLVVLVPIGLFGVAAGFASLPVLSQAVQKKDTSRFTTLIHESTQSATWLSMSALTAFALFATPLSIVLFAHGKFTMENCFFVGIAISAYGAGLVFNTIKKVLTQGYYALDQTSFLVINAFVYLAVNATLSALLAPRYGIIGLGLSNSVAACCDVLLNFYLLKKSLRHVLSESSALNKVKKTILFTVPAALALGLLAILSARATWPLIQSWSYTRITFMLCISLVLFSVFWLGTTLHWGPGPLRETLRKLGRRSGFAS